MYLYLLNYNREYIKHQSDLSLLLGIYQIYTPAGIFDVRLKQDINIYFSEAILRYM